MIPRAAALILCAQGMAMCACESARAGAWYTEPVIGVQTDYSTNPQLIVARHTSTADAAVLLDVPTTYTTSDLSITLEPTLRYSDTSGYASLVSNYEHLTAAAELDTERDSVKLTTVAERDSSLYEDYNLNGNFGVRQDTLLGDLNWIRALTERLNFSFEGDYTRVRYGSVDGVQTLTGYSYSSASPSLAWQADERTTLTLLGAFSLYKSSDGTTRSTDANIELGYTRQLTELWTFNAKGGLSRENDEIKEYFGPFLLGSFKSTQNGTVFSTSLTREGLRLNTTLSASRSLVPSGFAFLSRRDQYALQATYPLTPRWSVNGYVRYRDEDNPQFFVPTLVIRYTDLGATANWLATEHWTLSFTASHVAERYGTPSVHVAESALNLQVTRKFNRLEWH